jgi:tRNA threonylcarbamoyl adenosine modification protein (Sua5/YciO/YrdC/YwlC family)
MPPAVIDIRNVDDSRDVVHRAVQALAEGKLVAFPTETVYGVAASALDAGAVEKLVEAKGRQSGHPLALAVKSLDDARDYAPDMPALGERIARRCWPGPLTLVVDCKHPQ